MLRRNGDKFAQPIIKIVQDNEGKEVPEDADTAIVDLSTSGLEVVKSLPAPGTNAIHLNPEILHMGWRCLGGTESDMESSSNVLRMITEAPSSGNDQNLPAEMISLEHYSEKQKYLGDWRD